MKPIIAMFFIISVAACSPYSQGDHFFVESEGAYIPVYVTGNPDSERMIVFFHGGPGDSSLYYGYTGPFQRLSEDYRVVYWDQRSSGICSGNATEETIHICQYVADADQVITVLRELYAPQQLIVLGHSWGGGLSAAYLISNQTAVDLWIDVSGAHNIPGAIEQSRALMIDYAVAQTNSTTNTYKDREYWVEALEWYAQNPEISQENYQHHKSYVYDSGGMMVDLNVLTDFILENSLSMGFGSPYNYFSDTLNSDRVKSLLDVDQFDVSGSLSNITIPTLVIWGLHDGLVPVSLATNCFESVSTPSNHKFLAICSNSAHTPMYEEPDLFYEIVNDFLSRYQ